MRYDTFKSKLLPRKMGFQKQICIILTRKKNRRERHEWLHRKATAAKMLIFRWFYRYFLTASFQASQGTVPKSCSASKTQSSHIPFLTTPLTKNDFFPKHELANKGFLPSSSEKEKYTQLNTESASPASPASPAIPASPASLAQPRKSLPLLEYTQLNTVCTPTLHRFGLLFALPRCIGSKKKKA